jgi:hypothetical protein
MAAAADGADTSIDRENAIRIARETIADHADVLYTICLDVTVYRDDVLERAGARR